MRLVNVASGTALSDLSMKVATGQKSLDIIDIEIILSSLSLRYNQTAINYYYLLRMMGQILDMDASYIKRVPRYFFDAQFVRGCARVCPECVEHLSSLEKYVYLNNSFVAVQIRKILKVIAMIKV